MLRDEAQDRKKAAADKLAELQKLRDDQARLKSALDVRIAEFTAEVSALSREEANISGLIKSRELTGASVDGNPVPAKSSSGLIWPAAGSLRAGRNSPRRRPLLSYSQYCAPSLPRR